MARYRVIEIIETDGFGNERKLYTIQEKEDSIYTFKV